jgi:ATP-dependent Lhr-like helicase
VRAWLLSAGASFFDEIARAAGLGPSQVEDALWELVAAGLVTGDGFAGLRALLVPSSKRASTRRMSADRFGYGAPVVATGRWAVLRVPPRAPSSVDAALGDPAEEGIEALARQYLRRYGVVLREVLAREPASPAWRDLLRVYRRLEARGEVRGGRMVSGLVGEQFALPEALDALRALRSLPSRGEVVRLSACDPLNLAGIVTPGPRVPAMMGNTVVFRDGVVIDEVEERPEGIAVSEALRSAV